MCIHKMADKLYSKLQTVSAADHSACGFRLMAQAGGASRLCVAPGYTECLISL